MASFSKARSRQIQYRMFPKTKIFFPIRGMRSFILTENEVKAQHTLKNLSKYTCIFFLCLMGASSGWGGSFAENSCFSWGEERNNSSSACPPTAPPAYAQTKPNNLDTQIDPRLLEYIQGALCGKPNQAIIRNIKNELINDLKEVLSGGKSFKSENIDDCTQLFTCILYQKPFESQGNNSQFGLRPIVWRIIAQENLTKNIFRIKKPQFKNKKIVSFLVENDQAHLVSDEKLSQKFTGKQKKRLIRTRQKISDRMVQDGRLR